MAEHSFKLLMLCAQNVIAENTCLEKPFMMLIWTYTTALETYVHRNSFTSRKHLRTKVTPNLHLTYSKNGGNLGLVSK